MFFAQKYKQSSVKNTAHSKLLTAMQVPQSLDKSDLQSLLLTIKACLKVSNTLQKFLNYNLSRF